MVSRRLERQNLLKISVYFQMESASVFLLHVVYFSFSAITCSSQFLFYLQADCNVIKRIDSGALRFLYKLRVLILNDNLIPVLPAHLFR